MLLHTSTDKDIARNWKSGAGRFGSALFFVNGYNRKDAYHMSSAAKVVYALSDEVQETLNIAERYELDISEELEDRLDNFTDAEDSWDAQAELLQVAVEQGFDGVEDEDEQGTVYIIDGDKVVEKMQII